jgi:hypothetical protein
MAYQPTSVRWSPVERADRADGCGEVWVARLAPHDLRLRLRACGTIFRP